MARYLVGGYNQDRPLPGYQGSGGVETAEKFIADHIPAAIAWHKKWIGPLDLTDINLLVDRGALTQDPEQREAEEQELQNGTMSAHAA